MNRKLLPLLLIVGVLFIIVGAYLALSKSGNGLTALTGTTVQVPSSKMWVDTGIRLTAGQTFSLQAQGQWKFDDVHTCGPDGMPNSWPGLIVPNKPLAGLVAKVGNGQGFFVGSSFSGTAPNSGPLYLSINDIPQGFVDNFGTAEVTVR